MSAPNRRGEHILQEVTARATVDVQFRQLLLAEPEKTIFEAYGVTIPAGHRVRFMEKPADVDTLIVLPDVVRPDGELDDDDLDAVAGGTCTMTTESW